MIADAESLLNYQRGYMYVRGDVYLSLDIEVKERDSM
jgi:hypothetical protein